MKLIEIIPQYAIDVWVPVTFVVALFAAFVFGTIGKNSDHLAWIISAIAVSAYAIVMLGIMWSGTAARHYTYDHYVYKIDDSISLNEFYSRYEIVSKEKYSDIYTLKLKEDK